MIISPYCYYVKNSLLVLDVRMESVVTTGEKGFLGSLNMLEDCYFRFCTQFL